MNEEIQKTEYLRIREVISFLKISKTGFYRLRNEEPSFPSGYYLPGTKIPVWKQCELIDWVEQTTIH